MKVKFNQLDEQVNESNADFIIQQLKKENNRLHQLVNKYHESKSANKISDDLKTKKVGNNYSVSIMCTAYTYHIYLVKHCAVCK